MLPARKLICPNPLGVISILLSGRPVARNEQPSGSKWRDLPQAQAAEQQQPRDVGHVIYMASGLSVAALKASCFPVKLSPGLVRKSNHDQQIRCDS
jgi:hypothetical protein